MSAPRNVNQLNTIIEGLPLRQREILEGVTTTIVGIVKTHGSIGLLAMLVAASRVIVDLKASTVHTEIGDAVLAFHTPDETVRGAP